MHRKARILYATIATVISVITCKDNMLFSGVKISREAHLVICWCSYLSFYLSIELLNLLLNSIAYLYPLCFNGEAKVDK